jgi:hypothetical protein
MRAVTQMLVLIAAVVFLLASFCDARESKAMKWDSNGNNIDKRTVLTREWPIDKRDNDNDNSNDNDNDNDTDDIDCGYFYGEEPPTVEDVRTLRDDYYQANNVII